MNATIVNLTLTPDDKLKPCPFCGGSNQLLENSWTPSYWVSCECGAEVHGVAANYKTHAESRNRKLHERAKRSAIKLWNNRLAA